MEQWVEACELGTPHLDRDAMKGGGDLTSNEYTGKFLSLK